MNEIVSTSRNSMTPYIYVGLPSEIKVNYLTRNEPSIVDYIIAKVANHFKFEIWQLKGTSRKFEVTKARYIAIYEIRRSTTLSSIKIGKIFNRDHSTILYALDTYNDLLVFDKAFQQMVADVGFL